MKNIFLGALITAAILMTGWAIADVGSLPNQKPVKTDSGEYFTNLNQPYGVNWSDIVRYQIQAVNWVAIGFPQPTGGSAGGVNWTMPNAYVGG
jgi:hypothetical protein